MKYSYLPQLRKSYRTPEFPPKRLHNTSRKVLEQRRQGTKSIENILGWIASCTSIFLAKPDDEIFHWTAPQGLESYIQYFVRMSPTPKSILDFLEVPKEDVK